MALGALPAAAAVAFMRLASIKPRFKWFETMEQRASPCYVTQAQGRRGISPSAGTLAPLLMLQNVQTIRAQFRQLGR